MKVLLNLVKESFISALHEIVNNRLRAFLSLLGITIGIFCIVSVFTSIGSLEYNIRTSLDKIGNRVLYIEKFPWSQDAKNSWFKYLRRPNPDIDDFNALKASVPGAEGISMMFTINKLVKHESNAMKANIFGVTYDYYLIKDMSFEEGRYFTISEIERGSKVAIIGSEVADILFPGSISAIGKEINVFGSSVQIIGILEKEGEDVLGITGDDAVILNYNFVKKIIDLNSNFIGTRIALKAKADVSSEDIKDQVTIAMRQARRLSPLQEDDFAINEMSMFSSILASIFGIINFAGGFIGAFSILVGGFGVANIMFVSVKERTAIIGIKKALGARNFFILLEFLIEAIVLCLIGGVLGLILVFLLVTIGEYVILHNFEMNFKFVISGGQIAFGLIFSAIIGIVFGFIPAYIASQMRPVDAIRSK
jgi:putative ABC transport system permease protein